MRTNEDHLTGPPPTVRRRTTVAAGLVGMLSFGAVATALASGAAAAPPPAPTASGRVDLMLDDPSARAASLTSFLEALDPQP